MWLGFDLEVLGSAECSDDMRHGFDLEVMKTRQCFIWSSSAVFQILNIQ
jgi:hypothetical protein